MARLGAAGNLMSFRSTDELPMTVAEWSGKQVGDLDPKVLAVLGADDYLNRAYLRAAGTPIGLYIGYYRSQREGDVHA